MTKDEILNEIIDLDIEIERQFKQIEEIYQDIKLDMQSRDEWIKKLAK